MNQHWLLGSENEISIYNIICDGNRKIEYNRYKEISWIWVRIK